MHGIAVYDVLDPGIIQVLAKIQLHVLAEYSVKIIFLGLFVYRIQHRGRQGLIIIPIPVIAERYIGLFHVGLEDIPLFNNILDVKVQTHALPGPVPLVCPARGHRVAMLHVPLYILVIPELALAFGNFLVGVFSVHFEHQFGFVLKAGNNVDHRVVSGQDTHPLGKLGEDILLTPASDDDILGKINSLQTKKAA